MSIKTPIKPVISLLIFTLMLALAACSNDNTFTLSFDTKTDATIASRTVEAGQAIYAPDDPVREGYRFDGWMHDGEMFRFSIMSEEDIELEAKWSKYYTISFDTTGGSAVEAITIAEGDPIDLTEIPEKAHYKFNGWVNNGNPFNTTVMPSNDLYLEADWVEASTITFEAIVYDRHLDENIVIEVDSIVDVAGVPITPPESPDYAEYHFLSWQLDGVDYTFTTMPDDDITLTASWERLSNLPAMFIELYDQDNNAYPLQSVTREQYITSKVSIVNTSDELEIDMEDAVFKGRGMGSWIDSGDKRGYRLKFDDDHSVLGNPASRHWVLLANANFDDVTMFRNKLAYDMSNAVFSNIDYATTTEFVDLYVNGEYRGAYLLAEHLRVDEDRVEIDSEFGVEDTGYLIEYDAYAAGIEGVDYFNVDGLRYPFTMHSPKPDDYLEEGITREEYEAQVTYIQDLVQNMVTAAVNNDLDTFSAYADVDSFVDMYILHELFKNIDTGYSSFYIYRHPGGKLTAGPPWDFDATLGSSPTRGNGSPNGIYVGLGVQAFSSRTASEFLISLYETPAFKNAVTTRWDALSPEIQTFVDQTLSDEMVETYKFAMGRNFVRWPTPQGYGDPVSQETTEIEWVNNIDIARQWLTDRVTWLDEEWQTN